MWSAFVNLEWRTLNCCLRWHWRHIVKAANPQWNRQDSSYSEPSNWTCHDWPCHWDCSDTERTGLSMCHAALTGPASSLVVYTNACHQNNYPSWAQDLADHSPRHSMIYTGFVKPSALQTHCHNARALHPSDALEKLISVFDCGFQEPSIKA